MRGIRQLVVMAALLGGTACHAPTEAPPVEQDIPEQQLARTLFTSNILSERTYQAFATLGGGFGQSGHALKFVYDMRGGRADTYYTNANYRDGDAVPAYALYHFEFAREVLGVADDAAAFNAQTYYTDDKAFLAGSVQTYTRASGETLYALQFYPDDVIHEEGLVRAARVFRDSFRVPGARLALVATGPQQTFARVAAQLYTLQIQPMTLEQVLGDVRYLPLNAGEAWGVLRLFPDDQLDLRPTDIPVFEGLPLELSVVAGTITRSVQDVTSHVNLKAKERGTPNMVLRDAGPETPELRELFDKPVHLVVGKAGFHVEPSTLEEVEAKYRERMNQPWRTLTVADEPALRDYDDFCPQLQASCVHDGGRFGGKANGLGLLPNRDVLGRSGAPPSLSASFGYDLSPHGFAVPVRRYLDFLAANPALAAAVEQLIADEKQGHLSGRERAERVAQVQQAFYAARVPEPHLQEITSRMAQLKTRFPFVTELKFRSSANAEDIPGFDGAGLYDSFSVKYAARDRDDMRCFVEQKDGGVSTKLKVSPRTAQCAVKAVYASLWNRRAIDERTYARLDHASAAMGIAVVPAYDSEADVIANGVAITRALGADVPGYTLSLQVGNNLVTNPEPGSVAERTLLTFSADPSRPHRFTVMRAAVPFAGAERLAHSVLDDSTLQQLAQVLLAVEHGYCQADPRYAAITQVGGRADGRCSTVEFNKDKAAALDMEFKVLDNGHIVLKQVREFHGR